jgi:hypothetical protein
VRAGLIVCTALLMVSPAQACHRFSVWKYPFPQRCAVAQVQVDHSWFVEIADTAPAAPTERTPEQDADAREHDATVRSRKDELNGLLQVQKLNERAAGYQGVE